MIKRHTYQTQFSYSSNSQQYGTPVWDLSSKYLRNSQNVIVKSMPKYTRGRCPVETQNYRSQKKQKTNNLRAETVEWRFENDASAFLTS